VDVLTAKNAGVPCIAVTWGFRDVETLRAAGAEYFCDDAAALPAMIETILKR
jgi:phosphoglycolate phosphatase